MCFILNNILVAISLQMHSCGCLSFPACITQASVANPIHQTQAEQNKSWEGFIIRYADFWPYVYYPSIFIVLLFLNITSRCFEMHLPHACHVVKNSFQLCCVVKKGPFLAVPQFSQFTQVFPTNEAQLCHHKDSGQNSSKSFKPLSRDYYCFSFMQPRASSVI